MKDNPKMQQFVKQLLDQGYSDEEIVTITANIAEDALDTFVKEAGSVLGEEAVQSIEAIVSDTEAMEQLKQQYQQKTGTDTKERLEQLINQEISSYLAESDDSSNKSWQ